MALLNIKNLSFRYEQQKINALENVNMSVAKNSINVVIGPNGSGKTTLFRLILGLEKANGEIVLSKTISDQNYQVGYLPQRFQFDPYIPVTAHELLFLALSACKHNRQEKHLMIAAALLKVEADSFAKEKIKDLTGGQLQRVLLARAIVHNPSLLLLDEPEAGVDPGGEKVFYQLIKKLVAKKQVTALIASHEISLVREYADKVFCLNKTVIFEGDPLKVLTKKNLASLYQEKVHELEHRH